MLKLKQSKLDGSWVVYNPQNFSLHTHTKHKRIALKLKYIIEHRMVPTSKDVRFVDSLIRLTINNSYRRKLEEYRESLVDS